MRARWARSLPVGPAWRALAGLTAVFAAAGCAVPTSGEARDDVSEMTPPQSDGMFVAVVGAGPDAADPHAASTAAAVFAAIYDTLIVPGTDLALRPALATAWMSNDTATQWRLTLRDDVHFHDGRPMTATDVVASLERLRADGPHAWRLAEVATIEATGDHSVEITAGQPMPQLPARLAGASQLAIVPADTPTDPSALPVGTGPFRVVDARDDVVRVTRFVDHWGNPAELEAIEFRTVSDPDVRLAGVERDIYHWVDAAGSAEIADRVAGTASVGDVASAETVYLALNHRRTPFDEVTVRRSIARAVDRSRLVTEAFAGRAEPNTSGILDASVWSHDDQVLRRAGAVATALSPGEHAAALGDDPVELLVTDAIAGMVPAARALVRQLDEIGVSVIVRVEPLDTWLDRRRRGDFDALVATWSGAVDPFDAYHQQHHSMGRLNFQGFVDPDVDAALERAQATADVERRRPAYDEAVSAIIGDVSYVYLANPHVTEIIGQRVRGYNVHPLGWPDFTAVMVEAESRVPRVTAP